MVILYNTRRTKKPKECGSLSLKVRCLYKPTELSEVVASLALKCNGGEQVFLKILGCLK